MTDCRSGSGYRARDQLEQTRAPGRVIRDITLRPSAQTNPDLLAILKVPQRI